MEINRIDLSPQISTKPHQDYNCNVCLTDDHGLPNRFSTSDLELTLN